MRPADTWKDYELLDATDGNRLERWGETLLIPPTRRWCGRPPNKAPCGQRQMPSTTAPIRAAASGRISVQTTENNEVSEKPVEVEDGVSWTIDECYVSYYCKYKGQDFLMITYEMIKTAGDKVHTTNMIFLPPLESVCSSCQCCCRMRFRRPV